MGRETDPAAMVALTCGVAKGGAAVNIIPDEAELHIGVRTLNVEAAEHLKKRIPELIDHYVKAWNADYTLTTFHTPCTLTNELLCQELVPCLKEVLGGSNVHQIPAMSATEDFGYVTEKVPGMFVFLGAGARTARPCTARRWCLTRTYFPWERPFTPMWRYPAEESQKLFIVPELTNICKLCGPPTWALQYFR